MSVLRQTGHITAPPAVHSRTTQLLDHHPTSRAAMKRSLRTHAHSSTDSIPHDAPASDVVYPAGKRFASERMVTRNLGRLSLSPPLESDSPTQLPFSDDSVQFNEAEPQLVLTEAIRQQWETKNPSPALASCVDPVLARLAQYGALTEPPPRPLAPPDPSQALVVWRPLPLHDVLSGDSNECNARTGTVASSPAEPTSTICPNHFSTQPSSGVATTEMPAPAPKLSEFAYSDAPMDVSMV